ncbi:hypothetical protein [Micrococcus terreus]|uniref:hypothetical protein n=1 Tax=Micrococcus terreus TaxID=574650 RepID=UPI0025509C4C|nr:hypothetical protein [Micrococcus terreus]MDK7701182.1 hypothetical protein [Micrococcus terreus]WOO97809.1 hypothetical protein R3I42_01100 [Micrococcus terreus]
MPTQFYRDGPAATDTEERQGAGGSQLPTGWIRQATELVQALTDRGEEFTSADLRRAGLPAPDHANHWGSLFAHLQNQKRIRRVGLRIEAQPTQGSRPVSVWAGMDTEAS